MARRRDRAALTCIYCRATGVPFTRDHVIPEAFGTFESNLVLGCVCGSCNAYFGEELELVLGRDSGEALLRLRYGIKPVAEARDLHHGRFTLKVHVPGPWLGAQVILVPDPSGTGLETELVPQVALRKKGENEWTWYTHKELNSLTTSDVEPYKKDVEIRIIGPSQQALDALLATLKGLGVTFKQQGVIDQPITENGTILTQALYQIDQTIMRAIGKIAFNYVAYVHGAEFVLRPDFEPFRAWVRYGTEPAWSPVVMPVSAPILFDESPQWRKTVGHIVTFDWNKAGDGLLAQVSLFNSINYRVLMCLRFSGLWHDLRSGHHFDTETRAISKLAAASITGVVTVPRKRIP